MTLVETRIDPARLSPAELEALQAPVLQLDLSGRVLQANGAAARLFGVRRPT
jgi:PAS domain-containing protein